MPRYPFAGHTRDRCPLVISREYVFPGHQGLEQLLQQSRYGNDTLLQPGHNLPFSFLPGLVFTTTLIPNSSLLHLIAARDTPRVIKPSCVSVVSISSHLRAQIRPRQHESSFLFIHDQSSSCYGTRDLHFPANRVFLKSNLSIGKEKWRPRRNWWRC
ncbi:hypothetical protein BT67DRAFT_33314 [Trichocladium antarcticum]|uniref:Uncharacterized protein n=1 Tax=Trichocladium antarcticum TaxID=1450529 RepID=A0AAN6UJF5_9PEZI|nr:hypothetical protein BT67DRAFT_33314 [Trichocladium antarcticum]